MRAAENRAWYAAFKAKDVRFDGRFFVGVSSTGIYCRPICRAKLPKEENCAFYETAAAAEQAGYRPCLMCRPELAPGAAPIDATSALVRKAARLLEENCGNGQNMGGYIHRLGCSERHLRRAFTAELKVPPVQYLQTCRLLLAKNLLTDTDLPVTDVAMAAGFGSLRRFNDLFKKQYRLSPTALRKQTANAAENSGGITLALGYRPPYQWEQLIGFLAQQAIPGVETVSNDGYMRTVRYLNEGRKQSCGWLRVEHHPQKNALSVTVSPGLLPALPHVLARIRNLFDLYCYPDAVYETLAVLNETSPGLCVPGARLPGCFEPFETAVRTILNQGTTAEEAGVLAGKFAAAFGAPVDTGLQGMTRAFPSAQAIAALRGDFAARFDALGIPRGPADAIVLLARKIAANEIDFTLCARPEAEIGKLLDIPGIEDWTAQCIAMRAFGWPDAFPHTHPGFKKFFAPLTGDAVLKTADAWRPWRGYAAVNLWNFIATQGDCHAVYNRLRVPSGAAHAGE